jgi:hypothetical protein
MKRLSLSHRRKNTSPKKLRDNSFPVAIDSSKKSRGRKDDFPEVEELKTMPPPVKMDTAPKESTKCKETIPTESTPASSQEGNFQTFLDDNNIDIDSFHSSQELFSGNSCTPSPVFTNVKLRSCEYPSTPKSNKNITPICTPLKKKRNENVREQDTVTSTCNDLVCIQRSGGKISVSDRTKLHSQKRKRESESNAKDKAKIQVAKREESQNMSKLQTVSATPISTIPHSIPSLNTDPVDVPQTDKQRRITPQCAEHLKQNVEKQLNFVTCKDERKAVQEILSPQSHSLMKTTSTFTPKPNTETISKKVTNDTPALLFQKERMNENNQKSKRGKSYEGIDRKSNEDYEPLSEVNSKCPGNVNENSTAKKKEKCNTSTPLLPNPLIQMCSKRDQLEETMSQQKEYVSLLYERSTKLEKEVMYKNDLIRKQNIEIMKLQSQTKSLETECTLKEKEKKALDIRMEKVSDTIDSLFQSMKNVKSEIKSEQYRQFMQHVKGTYNYETPENLETA